jgi:hypothetical protein
MVRAITAADKHYCHERQTDHSQQRNDEKCGIDHPLTCSLIVYCNLNIVRTIRLRWNCDTTNVCDLCGFTRKSFVRPPLSALSVLVQGYRFSPQDR